MQCWVCVMRKMTNEDYVYTVWNRTRFIYTLNDFVCLFDSKYYTLSTKIACRLFYLSTRNFSEKQI